MKRITRADLDGAVDLLNRIAGTPTRPYRFGTRTPNIGHYHIDNAYGGWALHQMVNEAGAERDIFNMGHMPARELYNLIHAYRKGMETRQELETA